MTSVATKAYIEFKKEGYWVIGTRISLDSIVYAFRKGQLPESIAQAYPLLDLEKVYGAITFYLANQSDIDAYLILEEQAFDAMPQPLLTDAPSLHQQLLNAKKSVKPAYRFSSPKVGRVGIVPAKNQSWHKLLEQ